MIYFVQDSITLLIKIGYTSRDMESRMRAFKTGNPRPLVVLLLMDGNKDLESMLHVRFDASRDNGEWFRPTPELLKFICEKYESDKLSPDIFVFSRTEGGFVVCPKCGCQETSVRCGSVEESQIFATFYGRCGHSWEVHFFYAERTTYWTVDEVPAPVEA